MNKEQQELLDEAYETYVEETMFSSDPTWLEPVTLFDTKTGETKMGARQYAKKSFINKCKTDTEFSEKWGLKIEERELSLEERCDEYIKIHPKETNDGLLNYKWIGDNLCNHEDYDKWNIPTKLITITRNDKTIESYNI
jgi:hypothetical protein